MKKSNRKVETINDSHRQEMRDIFPKSEFLEIVLESLTHPFYVIDSNDYTIKIANSAARLGRITGRATCYALTHKMNKPCGLKQHPCPLELIKKTKKPVTVEHIHYDKDGNTRNVEVHGFPIFDNDGNVTQMIEYCLDITDRKRAEEALLFEKNKLTNILDSMEDGVYIASDQYDIEYINPALEKEFGPIKNQKCYKYFSNRKDKCPWCKSQKVFKGDTIRWEWHCPINNKTYDLLDTPIRNPDGSTSKLEIFRDITERKQAEDELQQSEQRYRSFVQNFQGIVYQGYLNFVPVFFHGAVKQITGYSEEEFTAGKPRWDQIIHPDDLAVIFDTAEKVRTEPNYATEREYRIIHKNKRVRWIHELIQNVCDDSGKPSLVQGAIYDITERKRMEEDLKKHHENLEELVQTRTKKLTDINKQLLEEIERRKHLEKEILNISERERKRIGQELHDSIGQHFTGIAFLIKVLEKKLADESLDVVTNIKEVSAFVNQAIDLVRGLAKGLDPIDISADSLKSSLQELAEATEQLFGVSCIFICDKRVDIDDDVVAVNVYRIVQESINNAIKHANAKSIQVSLSRVRNKYIMTIQNDGLAFQTKGAENRGMGLQIMKQRAEMINGCLDVSKADNGGTIVTCTFPRKRADEDGK